MGGDGVAVLVWLARLWASDSHGTSREQPGQKLNFTTNIQRSDKSRHRPVPAAAPSLPEIQAALHPTPGTYRNG